VGKGHPKSEHNIAHDNIGPNGDKSFGTLERVVFLNKKWIVIPVVALSITSLVGCGSKSNLNASPAPNRNTNVTAPNNAPTNVRTTPNANHNVDMDGNRVVPYNSNRVLPNGNRVTPNNVNNRVTPNNVNNRMTPNVNNGVIPNNVNNGNYVAPRNGVSTNTNWNTPDYWNNAQDMNKRDSGLAQKCANVAAKQKNVQSAQAYVVGDNVFMTLSVEDGVNDSKVIAKVRKELEQSTKGKDFNILSDMGAFDNMRDGMRSVTNGNINNNNNAPINKIF